MLLRVLPPLAVAAICLLLAPAARQSFAPAVETSANTSAPVPSRVAPPTADEFDDLARTRPLAMLDAALRRAEGELRGYRAVMTKQERMGGTLYPPETVHVTCREQPFAVLMKWTAGYRQVLGSDVTATRYDAGAKDPLLVYRPRAVFQKESAVNPRSHSARLAARVGVEESGVLHAARRTLAAWTAADQRGQLDVSYLGVRTHPDTGHRPCHVIRRTCREEQIDPFVTGEPPVVVTARNRADAFDTVTVWIDRETWVQVGTEQHRAGDLVARYFFHLTETNPAFGKDEFSPAALRK